MSEIVYCKRKTKKKGTAKMMESAAIEKRQKLSADRLCYLFLIFLAGCLVGWIYEEIFYWIT